MKTHAANQHVMCKVGFPGWRKPSWAAGVRARECRAANAGYWNSRMTVETATGIKSVVASPFLHGPGAVNHSGCLGDTDGVA